MSYELAFSNSLESHTLGNGLRVVLAPDRSRPLVTVNLWYHVGSKNEVAGKTGLAHLFEHMLFQGSEHVGTNDHFRLIQQAGGVANGSTSFDRTNYYETLPSHCLELGLWLESDRMGFLLPAMDEDKLQNQKDVVMNERRERTDNQPYGRAFERLQALAFGEDHPYSWPVIGWMEDIAGAQLVDVRSFFSTYYSPANAVLTLVGDFDPAHAFGLVEKYFGELAGPPATGVLEAPLAKPAPRRATLEDRIHLPRLYLCFPAPAIAANEFHSADLFSAAISSGKTSPLYREFVYERELAQDIYAGLLPLELGSVFLVVMTLRPDAQLDAAESLLRERLDGWRDTSLTKEHFERALNRTLVSYLHEIESFESRADLLSHFATFHGDPRLIDTEPMRYANTDPEDLKSFADRYLRPETASALWVVPEASP